MVYVGHTLGHLTVELFQTTTVGQKIAPFYSCGKSVKPRSFRSDKFWRTYYDHLYSSEW